MLQLFLNDTLVDLTDDSPIALTFQINNLADVKNQQGNTSNQFKLPLTQLNRQVLGFPDDIAFTNNLPYQQYTAKVVQDGMEIIPYGVAEINGVEQDTAAITVLSGNVDFFDAIDGKIYDTGDSKQQTWYNKDWTNYEHAWTLDNIVASQTRTDGWIWPVIDYGRMPEDFSGTPEIDVRYLRPGFFLHTAMDLFIKPTGYTINPDSFLLKQELYKKLIVQFANDNFEHGSNYDYSDSTYSTSAVSTADQGYKHKENGANEDMSFTNLIKGSHDVFDGRAYIAKTDLDIDIAMNYSLFFSSEKSNGAVTISLKLFKPGDSIGQMLTSQKYSAENLQKDGKFFKRQYNDQQMNLTQSLTTGQSIRFCYDVEVKDKTTFTLNRGATFTVTEKKGNVIYGQKVQCERIFPDIGLKDLLKDTLQRFGIICQTDATRKQVTFASFNDIVNNIPRAYDWTSRCLDQGKNITFKLGEYAQINYLKYKEDDGVLPKGFGDGQLLVEDKTLPVTGTLFESQFAPTLNRPYIGGSIAQIKKIDTSGDAAAVDMSVSTQPRLLIHDTYNLLQNGRSVKFKDGAGKERKVNDVICVPYFEKNNGTYSLNFDKLRLQYYSELQRILKNCKKVVRWFMLSPRDILELDLLVPVYLKQDGCYYYINKIDSWRKGQPTKVELIKLG